MTSPLDTARAELERAAAEYEATKASPDNDGLPLAQARLQRAARAFGRLATETRHEAG